MTEYQKWRLNGPDLAPLGVLSCTMDPDNRYFCTPVGAIVFGRIGVDGIHFCRIRRVPGLIFAVSPMNTPGKYVHPIARDFYDFLCLLITVGDVSVIEQAWMWDKKRFETEWRALEKTEEKDETIRQLTEQFDLVPIENPYEYLRTLCDTFDYDRIPFIKENREMCTAGEKVGKLSWRVVCQPDFRPYHSHEKGGTEYPLDIPFSIPVYGRVMPIRGRLLAYYVCVRGLVVDLYMDWTENCEIQASVQVNGRNCRCTAQCTCIRFSEADDGAGDESDAESDAVWEHYRLQKKSGIVQRLCFPWKTGEWRRCPAIRSCTLSFSLTPQFVDTAQFTVHSAGETFSFADLSGMEHTLTILSYEQEMVAAEQPIYMRGLRFQLEPPLPHDAYYIANLSSEDENEEVAAALLGANGRPDNAIGIIGGADGPTAVFCAVSPKPGVLWSHPRLTPVTETVWKVSLREPESPTITLPLYGKPVEVL